MKEFSQQSILTELTVQTTEQVVGNRSVGRSHDWWCDEKKMLKHGNIDILQTYSFKFNDMFFLQWNENWIKFNNLSSDFLIKSYQI